MSKLKAEIEGMLAVKRGFVDKHEDHERTVRWIAAAIEVLLECELRRIELMTTGATTL